MAQRAARYTAARVLKPDGAWARDAAIEIDDAGRIARVKPLAELEPGPAVALGRVAVIPGLVNAHSHAFQRSIRGATHHAGADASDDFWSWRRAMYDAALGLDADAFERAALRCYWEMALAGVTCVGEFHYLHHDPDGRPYDEPNELAHRAIRAARRAGLRITLLRVAYARAGFDRPADRRQRRFVEPDLATYLERLDALLDVWADDPLVSIGAAPHSIRAVGRDWLEAIAQRVSERGLVLHTHACEQRREVTESIAEYGDTPIGVLAEAGCLTERTTLVHATHLSARDLDRIAASGAIVCACPITERDLGDGFLPARALIERGVSIAVGSDSHAAIDLLEETRLIEYHERLRYERRNVLAIASEPGARRELWRALLPIPTAHGARSLGHEGGVLVAGAPADFITLSLDDPALFGLPDDALLGAILMSVNTRAVRDVFVAGRSIVSAGRHCDLTREELSAP